MFVCYWDVVRAACFACLFLKSPRGNFWQKAPPDQAWTRVCFGWELWQSAYVERRGEEEKCQARGLKICLCCVMRSSGREGQKQSENQKPALLTSQTSAKAIGNISIFIFCHHWASCVFYVTRATLVPTEISGKLLTLVWSRVNPLLGERLRDVNAG